MIRLKRAYEKPEKKDGVRILVDRVWPRGRTKAQLKLDRWMKNIAPSTALRKWFAHDPKKWTIFQRRYRTELRHSSALAELRSMSRRGAVTLVYGARDTEHNHAIVLKALLG